MALNTCTAESKPTCIRQQHQTCGGDGDPPPKATTMRRSVSDDLSNRLIGLSDSRRPTRWTSRCVVVEIIMLAGKRRQRGLGTDAGRSKRRGASTDGL